MGHDTFQGMSRLLAHAGCVTHVPGPRCYLCCLSVPAPRPSPHPTPATTTTTRRSTRPSTPRDRRPHRVVPWSPVIPVKVGAVLSGGDKVVGFDDAGFAISSRGPTGRSAAIDVVTAGSASAGISEEGFRLLD